MIIYEYYINGMAMNNIIKQFKDTVQLNMVNLFEIKE